jgi:nuclear transport factor 2 (NTF2) superfamily protein
MQRKFASINDLPIKESDASTIGRSAVGRATMLG